MQPHTMRLERFPPFHCFRIGSEELVLAILLEFWKIEHRCQDAGCLERFCPLLGHLLEYILLFNLITYQSVRVFRLLMDQFGQVMCAHRSDVFFELSHLLACSSSYFLQLSWTSLLHYVCVMSIFQLEFYWYLLSFFLLNLKAFQIYLLKKFFVWC